MYCHHPHPQSLEHKKGGPSYSFFQSVDCLKIPLHNSLQTAIPNPSELAKHVY